MKSTKSNQRKGYQDSVGVEEFRGKYRLNLARKHSRSYYGTDQKRVSTGLTICQENEGIVEKMAWDIHYDILRDDFDATLARYGLVETPKLTVVESIKSKQLSVLEIYDRYCEYRKGSMAETTFELELKSRFKNAIKEAVDAVGEDALTIRSYLIKIRKPNTVKECLRHLAKAYQLGVKHGYASNNPFDGMAEEIKINKGKNKTTTNDVEEKEESDTRAFTVNEMNAIIEAFETSSYRRHLAPIIKFLFWTGCRTGEAVGLKWRDIKWDKELIVFKRTYNNKLRIFKPTKTGIIRCFPMPKDGQLWNLLKSIPEQNLDDTVFKSKTGKILDSTTLHRCWHGDTIHRRPGVINELIAQGKVSQYLKLYATRHTFISHQVNIHKIPITTVAQWVGNGAMVSNNSYLDRDRMTVPGYSDGSTQSSQSAEQATTNNLPSQLVELLTSLTPEQIEQLKKSLNGQQTSN